MTSAFLLLRRAGISNDEISSDVITISRWIRRSTKEKLLTDEKNKGKVELLSAKNQSASIRTMMHCSFFALTPRAFQNLRKWYRKKRISEGNPSPLSLLPSELSTAGNQKKYSTVNSKGFGTVEALPEQKNQSASIRTMMHCSFFALTPRAFQNLRKWYRKKRISEGNPSPLSLLPSELSTAGNQKKYSTVNSKGFGTVEGTISGEVATDNTGLTAGTNSDMDYTPYHRATTKRRRT
ncbi:hypothetical protein F511_15826 [Dorcoceras hygrometricum]|uniref:Uncharacterized protein n=1 Tax=Dorcoceras hygrometricum TaxID=472368 RepID=A0A2Z7BSY0_9LAMI|nr:hypothetical protein F511_15826 [Dorcoceras hygrometricum]